MPTFDFSPFFTENPSGIRKPVFLDMANYTTEQGYSRLAGPSAYKFRKIDLLAQNGLIILQCKKQFFRDLVRKKRIFLNEAPLKNQTLGLARTQHNSWRLHHFGHKTGKGHKDFLTLKST